MATVAKKVRDEVPAFVTEINDRRNAPKRAKKKKWTALTDTEKDALLKQLVKEAGLLDES